MEVKIGDIFFATTYRLDAKWHITGEFTSLSSVKIHRIWRADDLAAWPLDYKIEETKPGRVVTAVQIGERQAERYRGPVEQAPWFRVDNRKHIFSYDQAEDEQREQAPKMQTGDVRLLALIEEWRDVNLKRNSAHSESPELDQWNRLIESLEAEIIATPASTNLGALKKLELADCYLREAADMEEAPPQVVLDLVRSVMDDVK